MEAECKQTEIEAAKEECEEQEFQMAIAESLGVPYTVPDESRASSSRSTSVTSNPAPPKVQTIPYQPPNITQHMNESWMRPTVDNTKKARTVNRGDLDNHFVLVFWGQV